MTTTTQNRRQKTAAPRSIGVRYPILPVGVLAAGFYWWLGSRWSVGATFGGTDQDGEWVDTAGRRLTEPPLSVSVHGEPSWWVLAVMVALTASTILMVRRARDAGRPTRWWTLGGSVALVIVTVGVIAVFNVHQRGQIMDAFQQGVTDPPIIGHARVETSRAADQGGGTDLP
ncbi:hypothetical protein [Kocuria rosea]|uniref:hypothetical protein n=1 Tax=Kocuria rosea TaxID=1275 RepID=UPI000D64FD5B|nr:hypothetical protein [Kocuria rosea]PWF79576.1 hypothetical protein DEJ38_17200 [Kocuria rosea]